MANEITLKFLTLTDIKAQVRVESDYTDDDTYLMQLGKAAENHLFKDIQRSYDEVVEMEKGWPEDLTLAALMLVAHWYQHRESTTTQSMAIVPYAYENLYMPYRKGTYSSED